MAEIKVVVVDDHSVLREGLCNLLQRENDIKVVGEAADEHATHEVVAQTVPDVILLDLVLHESSGVRTARSLLQRDPEQRILLFSAYSWEDVIAEGFSLGVLGYVSKRQPVAELAGAIRSVSRRERYLSPLISSGAVEQLLQQPKGREPALDALAPLSARERDVFELLIRGLNNSAIANELAISRRTVETHRARVMKKLQLHSLPELFRFAAQRGLMRDLVDQEPDRSALSRGEEFPHFPSSAPSPRTAHGAEPAPAGAAE